MQEINSTIKKVVANLTSVLSQRNREIVFRRFGLKNGQKETLESIGDSYGITRERVRQIEEAALIQMKENLKIVGTATLTPFVSLAAEILNSNGGVVNEKELFTRFSGDSNDSAANASFSFILMLSGQFYKSHEDDKFLSFWSISKERADKFTEEIATLTSQLEKSKKNIPSAEVDDGIVRYISISKRIARNVFGEIGLAKWAQIRPRGVRDKSYLVLKREGKPKHFREIAELINSVDFGAKKAHVQTVHNELIKDNRFVLVGRGIYGLSEWGYKPGTVKEVIANFIKSNGPQSRDNIVAHVMSTRFVKPNTVLLGIQDKKIFFENADGHIALKEA